MIPNQALVRTLAAALVLTALTAICVEPAFTQEAVLSPDFAGQSLRPYRFVFYAYAIAWLLVFGWVVSVARRMSSLERRLGK